MATYVKHICADPASWQWLGADDGGEELGIDLCRGCHGDTLAPIEKHLSLETLAELRAVRAQLEAKA